MGRSRIGLPPASTLSVRQLPRGGGVAPVHPDHLPRQKPELLILVHGFNVTKTGADSTYEKFLDKLASVLQRHGRGHRMSEIVSLYWPGDPTVLGIRCPLKFRHAVENARKTAGVLSEFFNRQAEGWNESQRIRFLGHSLGCRVILETLLGLKDGLAWRFDRIALVAAAVGENQMCSTTWNGHTRGSLPPSLRPVIQQGSRAWTILFSPYDIVLMCLFPFGSRVAREFDVGDAVGFKGAPAWKDSPEKHAEDLRPLDHDEYWIAESAVELLAGAMFDTPMYARPRAHVLPIHALPRHQAVADGTL